MNAFYHGDCLFVMKHDIAPESVDLIYLDPPFFTGKVQKGKLKWQPGAMEVSYEDSKQFWKEKGLASYAPEWLKHIALTRPDFASYLFYMKERLEACHKVLKKTGSIYLHCDYRASHYLKMIMDEVFGYGNYHSEIIWHYHRYTNSIRGFSKMNDSILWYTKTKDYTFNKRATIAKPTEYQKLAQQRGYSTNNINGKRQIIIFDKTKAPEDLSQFDIITHKTPEDCVTYANNVWDDIDYLASQAKERVGYPTQKPTTLLERIILASSNEGNLVLDPFCGCGTAIIAAQNLNRQWIGIDINRAAYEVSTNRLGELPLSFSHVTYISRDLDEVKAIDKPAEFEKWVNEYYKATKPYPDRGVDGITPEGTPIQVKTFQIKYDTIDKLLSSSKFHPLVPKPIKKLILVSQIGFDDSARKREFEIKATEDIEVILATPEQMLKQEEN